MYLAFGDDVKSFGNMDMDQQHEIVSLGDGAILIQFGNRIDDKIHAKVLTLFHQLQQAAPFIKEVVPSYSSLAVYYDIGLLHTPKKTAFAKMKEWLQPFLEQSESKAIPCRSLKLPVCYSGKFAPDLDELAKQHKLTVEDVVRLHTATTYRVYMIGFLPGFPYMGKVDERIATPRRSSPRTMIPAGSVGIAGEQTGIYPFASPGGWNIIGRTPAQLFNKEGKEPVLLQPGDLVTFYSITEDEFNDYQTRHA
jgi:inhibitor of KinA